MDYDIPSIVDGAIKSIRSVQIFIKDYTINYPTKAFDTFEKKGKRLVRVDALAEGFTEVQLFHKLKQSLGYDFISFGEESLYEDLDLSTEERLVILMDMIDGTDLLERELSNWCSAMVFYYPLEQRILASFVARPDDNYIYFASEDSEVAYKCPIRGKGDTKVLRGPSDIRSLDVASIAFYGQKVLNFLSVTTNERFLSGLKKLYEEKGRTLRTRIYNLAGNPMMMRLIDGNPKIDAVFDLEGQAPHDVVPGAYIAQKAKAVFCDLQGKPIDLDKALLRPADPSSRISYIVASTEELSKELRALFTTSEKNE